MDEINKCAARGFTLVEILVVVAILGVLAAIAIPLFGDYRKNSSDATALADAKNLILVLGAASK